FFYLNETFTSAERAILGRGNTLGKVIKANTNVTNLQSDVFRFLSKENGKSSGDYTTQNGQAELTGSQTGTTLTDSLKSSLLALLTQPGASTQLVLVDANGNYLSTSFLDSYASVKNFLQHPSPFNVANQLSIQLLTTEINILLSKVDATTSIFVPAVTIDGT